MNQQPTPEEVGVSLADGISLKRFRPRIVLLLLVGGALAGVRLSHLGQSPRLWLFWSTLVVTVGGLNGALYWRLRLFDGSAFDETEAVGRVRRRWRALEAGSVWLLVLCGVASFVFLSPDRIGTLVLTTGCLAVSIPWLGIQITDPGGSVLKPATFRLSLAVVALVSLAGLAWVETGTNALDWVIRFAHLGAFGLWLGGACWHNFIVRPILDACPAATDSLKGQARRFRRHVPVVIVVLFATGGYQVARLVGSAVVPTLWSPIGYLVGTKLFVLLSLTVLVVVTLRRAA